MLEKRRGSNDSSVTVASLVLGFSLGFFFFFILIAPLDSSHSRGEWSSQIWLFVKDYQMRKRKAFAKGNSCWHS